MQYRRFGRTNLQMPVLSCGGMRYQHAWGDVPFDQIPAESQANLEATIRHSLALGINHIETARGYGTSEKQLGLILPKLPRDQMIIQTKVGPSPDPERFIRDFEHSLSRLQLSYVDLLGIHGINNAETTEWALRPHGCLWAARQLQKRGLVRHVGFSTHGPTEVIKNAIQHEGDGGFDYVNLHWYYIYQKNWPAIVEATKRDLGVFIISPSDKGGMLYKPSEKITDLCRPLHPLVFNDLFCLNRPEVHTLSIGAARPTDFDLHVEAVQQFPKAAELLPPIVERLERVMQETVGNLLANPFTLNLPTWEFTPDNINIPIILWLRNLVLAYDLQAYGKMRYNLLGNGGHWFPGLPAEFVDELDLAVIANQSGLGPKLKLLLQEAHEMLSGQTVTRLSKSD